MNAKEVWPMSLHSKNQIDNDEESLTKSIYENLSGSGRRSSTVVVKMW